MDSLWRSTKPYPSDEEEKIDSSFATTTSVTTKTDVSVCSNDAIFSLQSTPFISFNSQTDLSDDFIDLRALDISVELEKNGPFSKKDWDLNSSFRVRYEIERVAINSELSPADIVEGMTGWYELSKPGGYDSFWKDVTRKCRIPPEKTSLRPWKVAETGYLDGADSVTLSATLFWRDLKKPTSAKLLVHPFKMERSCRFHRKFGPHRFLELTIWDFPRLRRDRLSFQGIIQWLAQSEHHIFGRVWRAFYIDEGKRRKNEHYNKIYLFAIKGRGLSYPERPAVKIEDLLDWHLNLEKNADEKDCKLFQRLHLGLSKTFPTVALDEDQLIFVEDMKSRIGNVLNDGCAMMSRSLGREVAERLHLGYVPSAFQARIHGAKGMWIVDKDDGRYPNHKFGFWIEIAKSQLKINPPPNCDPEMKLDEEQLTFEVSSKVKALSPANLNQQALQVLQHGKVNKEYIARILEEEISNFYKDFEAVVQTKSCLQARRWIQQFLVVGDGRRGTLGRHSDDSMFPHRDAERAAMMLESGFVPCDLEFLLDLFKKIIKNDYFDRLDALRVTVGSSTYAYCLADPYGVLEPGEVHLGFSRAWEGTFNGTELDNIDVLVSRCPAHLPTDIQKQKAIYKRELAHIKDAIVFSTKEDIPLAGKLSGGDYDGDTVWVCWDSDIVNSFENTPFVHEKKQKPFYEFQLVSHSRPLKGNTADQFLSRQFEINTIPSKLGLATSTHEKLCYHMKRIDGLATIELAKLLGILVDARKSGSELLDSVWADFRKTYCMRSTGTPAYKEAPGVIPHDPSNILDYLKFNIVEQMKRQILKKLDSLTGKASGFDPDLTVPYNRVADRANKERAAGDPRLSEALTDLKSRVIKAKANYSRMGQEQREGRIRIASDEVDSIRPFTSSDHPLVTTWVNSEYEWSRIRASCVYEVNRRGFAWNTSGPALCAIKLHSGLKGSFRGVKMEIYPNFKISRRVTASQEQKEDNCDDEMDDFDGDDLFDGSGFDYRDI